MLEEGRLAAPRSLWGEVLRRHLTDLRLVVDREVQDKKAAMEGEQDLGSRFNEPRLNQKVRAKAHEGEEEQDLFVCHDKDGPLAFECTVCGITVSGMKTMESHMNGKKHLAKLANYTVVEGSLHHSDPLTAAASLVPSQGLLSRLLPLRPPALTLAGSEFLAEVLQGRAEPEYHCLLCNSVSSVREVVPHLLTAAHQLAYLAQAQPHVYLQFAAQSSPELWGQETFSSLDTQVCSCRLHTTLTPCAGDPAEAEVQGAHRGGQPPRVPGRQG